MFWPVNKGETRYGDINVCTKFEIEDNIGIRRGLALRHHDVSELIMIFLNGVLLFIFIYLCVYAVLKALWIEPPFEVPKPLVGPSKYLPPLTRH